MVLFAVETGKRPCHLGIEIIFVFLADASQVHRDVSADTSSAVRASSVINKVDILKNALDLYHGKILSSADGEHWLIQFATKYHLSYMSAVSELLKQLDSLHSYDLLNQYAMKSLTIAPDNPKAYCWLIRSLKAQGMNELATNELAAAKEHLTTEEYEETLAFGVNW